MARKRKQQTHISQLTTYDDECGDLNVVIETRKGSRIKFEYDERSGMFKGEAGSNGA